MQKKHIQSKNHAKEIQTGPKVVEVAFAFECAEAKEIFLCGDFNQWSPRAVRMVRIGGNGRWEKRLVLPPGRYEYKFLVDGRWKSDPRATEFKENCYGSTNSVVEVQS